MHGTGYAVWVLFALSALCAWFAFRTPQALMPDGQRHEPDDRQLHRVRRVSLTAAGENIVLCLSVPWLILTTCGQRISAARKAVSHSFPPALSTSSLDANSGPTERPPSEFRQERVKVPAR